LHVSTIKSLSRINTLEGNPHWHSDGGSPSNAVGVNNDFYLDENNGNIYVKKNGIWV